MMMVQQHQPPVVSFAPCSRRYTQQVTRKIQKKDTRPACSRQQNNAHAATRQCMDALGRGRTRTARYDVSTSAAAANMTSITATFMAENPVLSGVIITVIRSVGADLFAQMGVEKKKWSEINWRRVVGFGAFGGIYVAFFMYYLYVWLLTPLPTWLGLKGKLVCGIFTMLVDQFIHTPFLYIPAYYLSCEWVKNKPNANLLADAYETWKREIKSTFKAALGVWLPAMTINFCVLPTHLMVPWINLVGLCWMVFLSVSSGGKEVAQHPMSVAPFDVVDTDGDGVISREEYAAAFGDKSDSPSFESVDTDGDGSITRDEYAAAFDDKKEQN